MVKKISELKDLQEDIKIDKTLDNLINSNNMNDFYNKIEELKNKNLDTKLMEDISEIYNQHTKQKSTEGIKKYDNLEIIKNKTLENKKKEQNLKQYETKERSLKKKLQHEIYNEKDTNDYNELYMIITGIHIVVFILVLVACIFPIINNVIITIVTIFMYIIMMSIVLIKFKKDEKRDVNDYNTFNMDKKNQVCKIKRKN